jgi:uncharacterized OB-fold protein
MRFTVMLCQKRGCTNLILPGRRLCPNCKERKAKKEEEE